MFLTARKNIAPTLLMATLCAPVVAQDYELVWSDEFEGTELDSASWSAQIGTGTAYGLPAGWGNNELQYYTNFDDNLWVSDGTLKIQAIQENFGGRNYTSSRIRTMGMRDFLYGRFEARMKLPSTSGVWPAFWMLPTNSPYGGWASSGEIDIMESVNTASPMYGTIHHGAPWPANQHTGGTFSDGTDFSQDFHVFAVEWEPDQIRWFIDGQEFHSVTSNQWFSSEATGNPRAPFDVPFHLILNVAVGGNFPGDPNGSASYPQTLEVDYVRVSQLMQSPFGESPSVIPGLIQAEDFDFGTNGQSYQDCDASNNGGDYRDTGVDIQASTEGGFNVGWVCPGEWIEYTVDVQQAGPYQVHGRFASNVSGGSFHIESDGQDITGTVQVPGTGGWQNWTTVTTTVNLEAGEQVLRFVNDGGSGDEYNFNSLEFVFDGQCSPADLNADGELDFLDISDFLSQYTNLQPGADLNNDGEFDFLDISEFLGHYSAGCP